jgi:hypothetical protein
LHAIHILFDSKGILKDFDGFILFLGDAMRVNSSKTLQVFWNLLADGQSPESGLEKLLLFFKLLLSLLDHEEIEKKRLSEVLNTIAESAVKAVMKAESGVKDKVPVDVTVSAAFELLKHWVCNYGPCISKVFESYLTEACFPNEKNPSFFPFRVPKTNVPSDLLPHGSAILILLSLYSDSLQGSWKRLYSSSSDGLSFNRMIHHTMGYEVRFRVIRSRTI